MPNHTVNHYLNDALLKGYISHKMEANSDFLPELLINNPKHYEKVLTAIEHELKQCEEFWFSIAFITTSGVATLINAFNDLKARKIKGRIVTSKYLNFTQPLALERLLNNFPNIELRIVEEGDFHAKGYLFKKGDLYNIIIGSSNLTSAALTKNKEWNLKISALESSYIVQNTLEEFEQEFQKATLVNHLWLESYKETHKQIQLLNEYARKYNQTNSKKISPNNMQKEALVNLSNLRKQGAKKAILISATGTGKTYLSAFDVQSFQPKRCLFIVHRLNIAEAAMNTYKTLLGLKYTYGLYSGQHKEINADFIFTTIQTLSQDHHLNKFFPSEFDYVIIDETHRAGANSYVKILNHFKPKFLLGMTATPERTDHTDIFSLFDHNIAYEIRLHHALEENMLTEFHYYGIQDFSINGQIIDDKSDFRYLINEERINHILRAIKTYGCDNGIIRGLVFCSNIRECYELSRLFNIRGYKAICLTGTDSEDVRKNAIERLESDDSNRLEYLFTVDIFNEGVDIPKVNQILMLRPTESAIIFVQQLGRGLRKSEGKEYLTIIDFIGNYSKNYLIPVALYGDTSYNKDNLRKLISSSSRYLPGSSTVNFDRVTKERIYASIDNSNMQIKKDLVKDYKILKSKLNNQPLMMDFIKHGSRNPFQYVSYSKSSFYAFASEQEKDLAGLITGDALLLLKYFSREINNAKRIEESLMLQQLIEKGQSTFKDLNLELIKDYGYTIDHETFKSAVNNLQLRFITEKHDKKLNSVAKIHKFDICTFHENYIKIGDGLKKHLINKTFKKYLIDSTNYSIYEFSKDFDFSKFNKGFVFYRKYSRKDCFRILNWPEQPLAHNVGGYMFHPQNQSCPIFLNYHKEDHISNTTKYEDKFINNSIIAYMSKSKRKLDSPDVVKFREALNRGIRLPLFIKKNNAEGDDFYYMGDVTPIPEDFIQTTMPDTPEISVVKMKFKLNNPVSRNMYEYITKSDG